MDDKNMQVMTAEEMEENAAVEAAADSAAQAGQDDNAGRIPFIVALSQEYSFEGKKIKEVDLSGLDKLTTVDGEYIEAVMNRMGHHVRDKFRDITYTKHIAMKVTGLPVEFFNQLKWKDQVNITATITYYFLM